MQYLTPENITRLLSDIGNTEIRFDIPLPVYISTEFCLMNIYGVSVDDNNRLWVNTSRSSELNVDNTLLYGQYILGVLYDRLKLLSVIKQQLTK